MENKVQFTVEAIDKASPTLKKVDKAISDTASDGEKKFQGLTKTIENNQIGFQALSEWTGRAMGQLTSFLGESVEASIDLENSLIGLRSIVQGTGNDFSKSKEFINEFTKDGLMTTAEAATSLKNLLSKGFNLKEASDLMYRFKDAAAFGRQSTLSLGEAVKGATEGIRNENSMLVDNAGITKNVYAMQEDYAKSIGKSAKELTEAEKRLAWYNGIMEESRFQVGDAAKVTDTLAGKQAKANAKMLEMRQAIGGALAPVLLELTSAITPIIASIGQWTSENPKLVTTIAIVTTATLALIAAVAGLALIATPLMAGLSLIGGAIAAIASPIGLIIGALALLTAAFYYNWGGISDVTNEVLPSILETISSAWEGIKIIFHTGLQAIYDVWNFVWNGIKSVGELALKAIGLFLGLAFQLITGDFEGFLKNLSAVWKLVWTGIKTVLQVTWQAIQSFLSTTWNAIKILSETVWNGIKTSIQTIVNAIGFFFTSEGRNAIYNGATGMFRGIAEFVSSIFNGIVNSIQRAINAVIASINWAISQANEVPGVNFGTIAPVNIAGARAEGGPVNSGSAYLVGEKGPELFMPGKSGYIVPNNRLSFGGMSGGITINLGGVVVNNGADENRLVDKIKRTIYQEFYLAKLG